MDKGGKGMESDKEHGKGKDKGGKAEGSGVEGRVRKGIREEGCLIE